MLIGCCCGGFCTCPGNPGLTLVVHGPPRFTPLPPAGTYNFVFGPPPSGLSGVSNFASLPNPAYWCATSYAGSPTYTTGFAVITCNDPSVPNLNLKTWAITGTSASAQGTGTTSNTFFCSPSRTNFQSGTWPLTQT